MDDFLAQPPLVRLDEPDPASGRQGYRTQRFDEVLRGDLRVVHDREHEAISDQGAELLHQIQRQRRPAILSARQ